MGGIPRSQVTLLYGYASSGKSTLCFKTIANAQKLLPDHETAYIDVEGRYDKTWAELNGVDTNKLWLFNPPTGEAALDIADEVIRRVDNLSVVVVDSLAALLPVKELERSTEDDLMGMQARLIGKFCRKTLNSVVEQRKKGKFPSVILLNQWRSKIGIMYGDPRTLPGGIAQHNTASVKIEVLNKEKEGKDAFDFNTVDYNEHSFRIAKNTEGVAIRHGEFRMIRNPSNPLGQGFIDDAGTVATWARKYGIITGSGPGGFEIEGVDQNFRILKDIEAFLYNDVEVFEQLKHKLICLYREQNGLKGEGWV